MKTLIVIPARLASTRLPNKMLLNRTGKPLIEHTHRAASRCKSADRLIVATDSEKIFDVVQAFGGEVQLTDMNHVSGTDRVAEVSALYPEYDIVVNIQGDEPEIEASSVDAAVNLLRSSPSAQVATVAVPLYDNEKLADPACVKLVMTAAQRALYFSRSPIPFLRNPSANFRAMFWQHVGIYVYRREFLLQFPKLAPTMLEQAESLEQLRVLENGFEIVVSTAEYAAKGIDTAADYEAFVNRCTNC